MEAGHSASSCRRLDVSGDGGLQHMCPACTHASLLLPAWPALSTPLPPRAPPTCSLLVQQWPLALTLLAGLLATKIAIISALGPLFGLSRAESIRTGFVLSQVRARGNADWECRRAASLLCVLTS